MRKSLVMAAVLFLAILTPFAGFSAMAQDGNCTLENSAFIGLLAHGMNCVDSAGWHNLDSSQLPASSFDDISVCLDGTLAATHIFGTSLFDGTNWTDGPKSDIFAVKSLACGANGEFWVAGMDGVGHYDGSAWTKYGKELFGSSPFI